MWSTCSWRLLDRAWPFEQALDIFGYLDAGAYSTDDYCFYPDAPGLGPISDRVSELQNAPRLVSRGAGGERDWTIFVVARRAAAVVADRRIHIRWDAETSRATGGLETLPDFIRVGRVTVARGRWPPPRDPRPRSKPAPRAPRPRATWAWSWTRLVYYT